MSNLKKDGTPRKSPVRTVVDPAAALPTQLLRVLALSKASQAQKLNALTFVTGSVQAEK